MCSKNSTLYWPFKKARAFAHSLNLKTSLEYQKWAAGKIPDKLARPREVPSNPHQVFRKNWKGYADWLGTDHVANFKRTFLPYDQARAFVIKLGLQSGSEWNDYRVGKIPLLGKRPQHIPSNPNVVYKNAGWGGIRHWLGIGGPTEAGISHMMPFADAKSFACSLGLSGFVDWRKYVSGKLPSLPRLPANLPKRPDVRYQDEGWLGYGDFLGTQNIANHQMIIRPFPEARGFARSLGFRTSAQWKSWLKSPNRPADIPANPEKAYATQWKGWRDWLRTPFSRTKRQIQ